MLNDYSEVRKDVHFVQSDLRDLLLRRCPACPGCDEVSLVKRGWECPAQMSKFTKFFYSLIGSTFFEILFWWTYGLYCKSWKYEWDKGRGVYCRTNGAQLKRHIIPSFIGSKVILECYFNSNYTQYLSASVTGSESKTHHFYCSWLTCRANKKIFYHEVELLDRIAKGQPGHDLPSPAFQTGFSLKTLQRRDDRAIDESFSIKGTRGEITNFWPRHPHDVWRWFWWRCGRARGVWQVSEEAALHPAVPPVPDHALPPPPPDVRPPRPRPHLRPPGGNHRGEPGDQRDSVAGGGCRKPEYFATKLLLRESSCRWDIRVRLSAATMPSPVKMWIFDTICDGLWLLNTTYLFFSWTTSRITGDRLSVTQRPFRNYRAQPLRRNAQSGFMTHPSL